ncbi:MAG: alpha-galactosidase [Rikenellaceae bacterium]
MKKLLLTTLFAIAALITTSAQEVVIPIETAQKGYYLVVSKDGKLWQGHFGDKLANADEVKMVLTHSNKCSAFPTFGTGYQGEPALQVTHSDGNMTTRLVYDNHKVESLEGGKIIKTVVTLRDEYYPLNVDLVFKAYVDENIFAVSNVITNNSKKSIKIESAMSNFLMLKGENYWLTRYFGGSASEMHMNESQLENGTVVIESKSGVRTTRDCSPSFIISLDQPASETCGEVVLGSLAWSGSYKLTFEYNNVGRMNITSGMNDFLSDYTIERGKSFETPDMILAHSSNGVGEASRNLHRWVRNHNLQDGDVAQPVVLNSWEGAYFSFDEDVIKNMIVDAASMGVEIFVLDDGWFGTEYPRNGPNAGLGDWQINYEKLPNGLQGLIDCCKENNVEFGLWVEPEMVNPKSELANKHPEWIVTSPNRQPILERNQRLLDLSNPKVREFVYNTVVDILKEYPEIKYIKWDANSHVIDFGSEYLATDKQSHFWIDYIRNLYDVYERLSNDFPDVIFQACSSGAGRVDYGSMKYHHEFWGSDNTDAEKRLFINWGLSQFFPAQALASHVSVSPNHQTRHISPIKMRFDVAMAQRLGVELQPKKLTAAELQWTKDGIAIYKEKIRPVVQFGDQYRLISPYGDSDFAAMMYVDEQKSRAILFSYSLDFHFREEYPEIKLQGLDPNKMYRVNEVMPLMSGSKPKYMYSGEGKVLSGDFLMKYGMRVNLRFRNESAVFELTEVAE